ncbi:MAG: hypothetical protein IPJ39_12655 [Saprospiraceae bacterium]|nr:hypothetical protein [Saprospiraceae bacterium]
MRAQRIENIGLTVKMMVDAKMDKQLSSPDHQRSDLGDAIQEPLTGRKWDHYVSDSMVRTQGDLYVGKIHSSVEQLLVYGS